MADVFHRGELEVQALAGETAIAQRNGVAISGRVMSSALPFIEKQSMAVLAFADADHHVWTSILFGSPGFVSSADGLSVEIDTHSVAQPPHDPFWSSTFEGRPVGMLLIELASRRRIRINVDLTRIDDHLLRLAVRESFPNCPKYITRRGVRTSAAGPQSQGAFSQGKKLGLDQIASVNTADTFFIGTVHQERGVDASHRGGRPGFVQALDPQTLRIPDYSGNGMFNTLGNLAIDARAGITIPDLTRRVILRMSGRAETLWNQYDDDGLSGGTHRFLHFHVERWNEEALPPGVESEFFDYSPYNPPLHQNQAE